MARNLKQKSITMISLMFFSVVFSMISIPLSTAAGINQTIQGNLNGQETWTGAHTLVDNVTVSSGAKLTIAPGTIITIPYGKHIDVKGGICIASAACGGTNGDENSRVKLSWTLPTDYTVRGSCLGSVDTACGSGMIIRNTINEADTGLNFVEFENAFGYEVIFNIGGSSQTRYGALVFDGPSTTANELLFTNTNSSNILLTNLANPTITNSNFILGSGATNFGKTAAISAYGAGAGISDPVIITTSTFTGDPSGSCDNGISMLFFYNSYASISAANISENSFGVKFEETSGELLHSNISVNCGAVDTKGFKQTGLIKHDLTISNNNIETVDSAGITAYDQARVTAQSNNISGSSKGSGVAIRSSTVDLIDNQIGPIGGFNGVWIYGTSEVSLIGNRIFDTGEEPVVHGEYHYKDYPTLPAPAESRLFMKGNIIENNFGMCNSEKMYGGDFKCPAIHIFRASATLYDNIVRNSTGDALRIKGGIVNVVNNTMETESFAVNISHHDDNYGNKYGSIGYFSQNKFINATQVYNITESRVTIQSEEIPDASGNEIYPINLQWLGQECPGVSSECLKLPDTVNMPPAEMPMSLELVNNSTVLSYANLSNFDKYKIKVYNKKSPWGTQVREGEIVTFRVKVQNNDVDNATVIIKNATGFPLYELITDEFGNTPEVTLASDFYLDRNGNGVVGEQNVTAVFANTSGGGTPISVQLDENTCSDGYDNDGDTFVDSENVSANFDPDCSNGGREIPKYIVEAYKFGKGIKQYEFSLTGPVDDIISLENIAPSVTVEQTELTSFARIVSLSGTAWDGLAPPYDNDYIAQQEQFGFVEDVQIQLPGKTNWESAIDTSDSGGVITQSKHPFSSWQFDYDMSLDSEYVEGDVTFRIRSFDGLKYSPVEVIDYKLNLEAPSIVVNTPAQNSQHDSNSPIGSIVSFSGTSLDPYIGALGSDIKQIWFELSKDSDPLSASKFAITPGEGESLTNWQYDWDYSTYKSGDYTFKIWAADSDFCKDDTSDVTCQVVIRNFKIINENAIPIVVLDYPFDNQVIRGSESTSISGFATDNDGSITRVDIDIYKDGRNSGSSVNTITITQDQLLDGQFNTSWNLNSVWRTNNLPHDSTYEIVVRSFDGESYSSEKSIVVTIDNSIDNSPPVFNPAGWANTVIIYCDANSRSFDRCGAGAEFDLNQYFTDPEGGILRFNVYNDSEVSTDDLYYSYISISSDGIATYNPSSERSDDLSEWSLFQLKFIAEDPSDVSVLSRSVNIVVKSVVFEVFRDNTGVVSDSDPVIFSGQGLPNSLVKARFDSKTGQMINSTRVLPDGTWSMEITGSQLGSKSDRNIVFEMDGQIFSDENGDDFIFKVSTKAEGESGNILLYVVIGIVILIAVIGIGSFFITFEEYEEEEDNSVDQPEEDPYAWAKNKVVHQFSNQQVTQQVTQQTSAQVSTAIQQNNVQQSTSQHPGWLWDTENNQWVPDPNYVNNNQ